ncbi:mucin-5AC-like [Alligator sinensis]|uniref:Mucin-5AC-like n=1 Tax=Alligator sinensis TaxID=38654 RepID=A0A3Q0FUJ3_ALLSI|nr:mucin-5AC-like [Alligator sinensis]XP_025051010.1 mucin-5AC-like [Alligator sinensis]XP_025051011.1 mucin-5AC-like [Alligator sinensis]
MDTASRVVTSVHPGKASPPGGVSTTMSTGDGGIADGITILGTASSPWETGTYGDRDAAIHGEKDMAATAAYEDGTVTPGDGGTTPTIIETEVNTILRDRDATISLRGVDAIFTPRDRDTTIRRRNITPNSRDTDTASSPGGATAPRNPSMTAHGEGTIVTTPGYNILAIVSGKATTSVSGTASVLGETVSSGKFPAFSETRTHASIATYNKANLFGARNVPDDPGTSSENKSVEQTHVPGDSGPSSEAPTSVAASAAHVGTITFRDIEALNLERTLPTQGRTSGNITIPKETISSPEDPAAALGDTATTPEAFTANSRDFTSSTASGEDIATQEDTLTTTLPLGESTINSITLGDNITTTTFSPGDPTTPRDSAAITSGDVFTTDILGDVSTVAAPGDTITSVTTNAPPEEGDITTASTDSFPIAVSSVTPSLSGDAIVIDSITAAPGDTLATAANPGETEATTAPTKEENTFTTVPGDAIVTITITAAPEEEEEEEDDDNITVATGDDDTTATLVDTPAVPGEDAAAATSYQDNDLITAVLQENDIIATCQGNDVIIANAGESDDIFSAPTENEVIASPEGEDDTITAGYKGDGTIPAAPGEVSIPITIIAAPGGDDGANAITDTPGKGYAITDTPGEGNNAVTDALRGGDDVFTDAPRGGDGIVTATPGGGDDIITTAPGDGNDNIPISTLPEGDKAKTPHHEDVIATTPRDDRAVTVALGDGVAHGDVIIPEKDDAITPTLVDSVVTITITAAPEEVTPDIDTFTLGEADTAITTTPGEADTAITTAPGEGDTDNTITTAPGKADIAITTTVGEAGTDNTIATAAGEADKDTTIATTHGEADTDTTIPTTLWEADTETAIPTAPVETLATIITASEDAKGTITTTPVEAEATITTVPEEADTDTTITPLPGDTNAVITTTSGRDEVMTVPSDHAIVTITITSVFGDEEAASTLIPEGEEATLTPTSRGDGAITAIPGDPIVHITITSAPEEDDATTLISGEGTSAIAQDDDTIIAAHGYDIIAATPGDDDITIAANSGKDDVFTAPLVNYPVTAAAPHAHVTDSAASPEGATHTTAASGDTNIITVAPVDVTVTKATLGDMSNFATASRDASTKPVAFVDNTIMTTPGSDTISAVLGGSDTDAITTAAPGEDNAITTAPVGDTAATAAACEDTMGITIPGDTTTAVTVSVNDTIVAATIPGDASITSTHHGDDEAPGDIVSVTAIPPEEVTPYAATHRDAIIIPRDAPAVVSGDVAATSDTLEDIGIPGDLVMNAPAGDGTILGGDITTSGDVDVPRDDIITDGVTSNTLRDDAITADAPRDDTVPAAAWEPQTPLQSCSFVFIAVVCIFIAVVLLTGIFAAIHYVKVFIISSATFSVPVANSFP